MINLLLIFSIYKPGTDISAHLNENDDVLFQLQQYCSLEHLNKHCNTFAVKLCAFFLLFLGFYISRPYLTMMAECKYQTPHSLYLKQGAWLICAMLPQKCSILVKVEPFFLLPPKTTIYQRVDSLTKVLRTGMINSYI